MKKIALIMEGWKRFFTYAWPAGILQRIHETDEEVNLYIFNSSGGWSLDKAYNVGEHNIYRLPDLAEFDGIILDLNNIWQQSVREEVILAAKASGKPVISIANEVEDFYYVGIDNEKAMTEVIAHLYEKHDCQKFWFIMGAEDNFENNLRMQAMKAFMKEHEIALQNSDCYFDSFEFSCGYEGFQDLCKKNQKLPDAVICANDNIAVGVCEAAKQAGYRVPEDFCVTGFDDFDKAAYYMPSITTVSYIREEVGYLCVDLLLKIWSGQEVSRINHTKARCVLGESCGCHSERQLGAREHAKGQIIYGIETERFEDQVIALEYALMRCKSVREMMDWIPRCIPAFQCDAMYLVLDDRMNNFRKRSDYYEMDFGAEEELLVNGYSEEMNIEFAYEDGKTVSGDFGQIRGLFPMFDFSKGGTDFLFLPLHFRDKAVGYFVIRNATYLMEKQYLFKVMNVLTSAMENLHKKEKLEYMNQALSNLYVRDAMTGLYNRMGYQSFFCRKFREKKEKKEDFLILFIDMDRLKFVNDTFGHEYGDLAIKKIAQAILRHCPKRAIPVRTGGDEFLIGLPLMEQGELDSLLKNIRDEISDNSGGNTLPFELTVSIGCIRTDMSTDKTLNDYVREADEIMYREKVKKKVQRK